VIYPSLSLHSLSQMWKVLALFLIPIGGGIPAGVLMAKSLGIVWPVTMFLYFISDVMLACVFEPILILFIRAGKHFPKLAQISLAFKEAVRKTTELYGTSTGPFALVMIAFGVDPMTGRAVAVAAGHGFFTGWLIAITGDMLYFTLLMVSTLWLNNIIGDGTWTMIIILGAMMVVPLVIKKFRKNKLPHDPPL
jgi:uncharacterized membrane protein